jgi:hypothetical protein
MASITGIANELWQTRFRSDHGALAVGHVQAVRGSLRRRAQSQKLLLSRSVPVHGLCAIDLAREPSRCGGVPASAEQQTLSSRHPQQRSRNTLANANATRDWRIYCEFAQSLIGIARRLYARGTTRRRVEEHNLRTRSTTIDLCLSVFSWAPFRSTKAAVKLHTLLDLRGSIPSFVFMSDGKFHDVNVLDHLVPEPGAFYVMDRAYRFRATGPAQ